MKYRLIHTLFFVCILANVSVGQSEDKTLSIAVSYARPLGDMHVRNNPSFGGFLMYGSPIDEMYRFTLEGGAYMWARNSRATSEEFASSYKLSVPVIAGVDILLSDNYRIPFFGVRTGIQFYWGVSQENKNQAGFLVHPEIGWRFPFSTDHFLDVRGGYTYGTGEASPFSYATLNLGFAFAL